MRLEGLGACSGDRLTGGHAAGEGDHVRVRVGDELVARGGAAGHALHETRRQDLEDLHELQGGQRRVLRRLDDHGVAGRQRRDRLPAEQHEGVVERQDDDDDTHRLLDRVVHLPRDRRADDVADVVPADLGVVVRGRHRPADLVGALLVRLAHLAGQQLGDLGQEPAHRLGRLVQLLGAHQRRLLPPGPLGGDGEGDDLVDLGRGALGDLAERLAGRRVEDGHDRVRGALPQHSPGDIGPAEPGELLTCVHVDVPLRCRRAAATRLLRRRIQRFTSQGNQPFVQGRRLISCDATTTTLREHRGPGQRTDRAFVVAGTGFEPVTSGL